MSLWTPPGADLGENDHPQADRRMVNFLGGLDPDGQPLPMTFRRLREHADKWPITDATPAGPRQLLKTTQDMFAQAFYSYELATCACAWSIFAVEAALKARLQAAQNASLKKLIDRAKSLGLVDEYLADILDTGREIRNNFVHEGVQPVWTFGMADMVIGASFRIVAELFPETRDQARHGLPDHGWV
jgi:hypothetical protein